MMTPITIHTRLPEETEALGRRLAVALRCGDVVALYGSLGAGKTQFVRGVVAGLGGDAGGVSSPTFVQMNEYAAPTPILHIDAYRIRSLAELESTGFTPALMSQSITLIEWAERIEPELPAVHLRIELSHEEGGRCIVLHSTGLMGERVSRGMAVKSHKCPTCGNEVSTTTASYPFCTDRCRMVDLGKWFEGGYSLSRPLDEGDFADPPP